MEKKKEDEANIYKEMEQVGKRPKKSEQIGKITKSLHIFSLGEGTGKREAFW